ncbi:hypothetical protein M3Y98_00066100 [Aphelenchoides besseyi]|nr:hypothetical protein M3Y98_00066100 [Aphelenchoides besseyi]
MNSLMGVQIATLINGIVTLISQTLGFAGALADVYSETYDLWRWRPTAGIVFCVIQWGFALLLIHGVLTKNPYFYYPFLIVQFLQCLVLFTFVAIFSIFTFFMFVAQFDIQQYTSYDALSLFVATILLGLIVFVKFYFDYVIVRRSQYQWFKEQSEEVKEPEVQSTVREHREISQHDEVPSRLNTSNSKSTTTAV